jgi:hypothetical protein
MAGTLDRVVTSVATQLMLATECTADEVSENAWLRGAYRVGQGDAMTSGRSLPCRSFTKVHAVSELTFWASQRSFQSLTCRACIRQALNRVITADKSGQR